MKPTYKVLGDTGDSLKIFRHDSRGDWQTVTRKSSAYWLYRHYYLGGNDSALDVMLSAITDEYPDLDRVREVGAEFPFGSYGEGWWPCKVVKVSVPNHRTMLFAEG